MKAITLYFVIIFSSIFLILEGEIQNTKPYQSISLNCKTINSISTPRYKNAKQSKLIMSENAIVISMSNVMLSTDDSNVTLLLDRTSLM